jgi:DNA-binding CsgD family transcriptional regulator
MVDAAVPTDRIAFAPVDEAGELCDLVSLDSTPPRRALDEAWSDYVLRYRTSDPFAPARLLGSCSPLLTVDDVGGRAAFARSEYGGEFLAELGYAHELRVYLRDPSGVTATIVLARREGEHAFSRDELVFLRRAQPAIELSYTCATAPQPAFEHGDALSGRGLTPREIDVARLVAGGASNRDVATTLLLSESTVKTHLKRVYAKLDVHTRTQLALLLGPGRRASAPESGAGGSLQRP